MDPYEWFKLHCSMSVWLERGTLFIPSEGIRIPPPFECNHWDGKGPNWTSHKLKNCYSLDDINDFVTDWVSGRCVYVAGTNLLALSEDVSGNSHIGYDPCTCTIIGLDKPFPKGVYLFHPVKGWLYVRKTPIGS